MATIYDVVADWVGGEPEVAPPLVLVPQPKTRSFGARRTREAADRLFAEWNNRIGDDANWENLRIEEVATEGLFEIPPRPTPRERYSTRVTRTSAEGEWTKIFVEILDGDRVAGSYKRNYAMLRAFEPFRQGDRDFALISPDYTATSVMDLENGEIVAGEERNAWGFCPVGFYVPDWWDVHPSAEDIGTLPGSRRWNADLEWPRGDFGFVWGCVWGDDSSWKVQFLDLSRIQEGELRREERFGYLILETGEREGQERWRDAREFIDVQSDEGEVRVQFLARQSFDLETGKPTDPWG
jgi:hypothetical protein